MHKAEFEYNGKPFRSEMPEKWEELKREQLLRLCYLISLKNKNVKKELKNFVGSKKDYEEALLKAEEIHSYKMRTALAYHFAGCGPKRFFKMNFGQLEAIIKLQDFLFEEIKLTKFLVMSFRFRMRNYYSPGDNCMNTTVAEMAYADNALAQYITTGKEEYLCKIIAALYRPSNAWRRLKHFLHDSDIRVRFDDRVAERRAKKFAKLPEHMKQAMYYQFKGCRTMEALNNPEIYGGSKSKLGWAGTLISMAGTKFGPLPETESTLWNNALVLIKQTEDDRKKIEKEFKKNKSSSTIT